MGFTFNNLRDLNLVDLEYLYIKFFFSFFVKYICNENTEKALKSNACIKYYN